jgi:cytochrome bd-type quinol oxidase subunit 2
MINKNISKIINISVATFFLINFFSFSIFSANASPILNRLKTVAKGANYNLDETDSAVVAGRFIAIFLSFLGVIFVLLAIYAGYNWMTAEGNAEKIEQAKKTLTQAAIGLAIIVGAYVIAYFIVASITEGYFDPKQL